MKRNVNVMYRCTLISVTGILMGLRYASRSGECTHIGGGIDVVREDIRSDGGGHAFVMMMPTAILTQIHSMRNWERRREE